MHRRFRFWPRRLWRRVFKSCSLSIYLVVCSTLQSVANSCVDPPIKSSGAPITDEEMLIWWTNLSPATEDEFYVYGTFQPVRPGPYLHELDQIARKEKQQPRGDWNASTGDVQVEYTYRNLVSFDGHILRDGHFEAFQTTRTEFDIAFDGEFALGSVPKRTSVISKVRQNGVYFHIGSSPCWAYLYATPQMFETLRTCILSDLCN